MEQHHKVLELPEVMDKKYTLVSLFSGAGGLDRGFEDNGFSTVWANDIDKDACKTHSEWSSAEVVQADVSKLNLRMVPDADVIAGGFPCQGFSLAGPRKINDERNSLYRHFVQLVDLKQPAAFVAENVKGILTLGDGAILNAIIAEFSDRGYTVIPKLLNAADFGVAQDRWRVFLVGIRNDLKNQAFSFPEPLQTRVSIQQALRDVPIPETEDITQDGYSSRYMSRNRRRGWEEVSYTIPAMGKQVPLHPSSPLMEKLGKDEWKFGEGTPTRRFSWQEAAAIQSFPIGFPFQGSLTSKYRQIGNAVPVKLAGAVAKSLKSALDSVDQHTDQMKKAS